MLNPYKQKVDLKHISFGSYLTENTLRLTPFIEMVYFFGQGIEILQQCCTVRRSRDGAVGIATGYGLDGRGIGM
jgi:hypothetical protein